MSLELKRLIQQVSRMDIRLLAGRKGLHNQVTWVHMVESQEVTDFLDGGEIVFMTGIGIESQDEVLSLVKNIHKKHAAGIVINTGPFLEKVPKDVIQYCESKSFPLFQVPWKVHLANIMRTFCYAITKEDQKYIETAAAFKNAIFFPKQEELYIIPLSQNGFSKHWAYTACVIKFQSSLSTTEATAHAERVSTVLFNHLCHYYKNFCIFSYDSQILGVTANYSNSKMCEFINSVTHDLKMICSQNMDYTIGVGKTTRSIRCLFKSYRQAESVRRLQVNHRINNGSIYYSDMGLYKLLMNIDDRDVLEDYYEHTILPLVEYDQKNESNLTQILQCYLKNNGSVKETADELFVHRNTINYKLAKIKELTNMDLSTLDARMQLAIGLMLQNIL